VGIKVKATSRTQNDKAAGHEEHTGDLHHRVGNEQIEHYLTAPRASSRVGRGSFEGFRLRF
jgi:hypothetical protein